MTDTVPASRSLGPFRKDHIPELDGLRGIAILLVLWVHLPFGALGAAGHAARETLRPGNVGVDLFFVLSGFLITRILLVDRGQGVPVRYFMMRRFLRIFPIYYLTILLLQPVLDLGQTLSCVTYTSNFYLLFRTDWCRLEHTWSLAVEEHFYLLWPPIVAFAGLVVSRRVLLFGVFPIAIGTTAWALLRGDWVNDPEFWTELCLRISPIRFFSLGLGALMAYHETTLRSRTRVAVLTIALLVLGSWALSPTGSRVLGYGQYLAQIPGTGGLEHLYMRPLHMIGMPLGSAALVLLGIAWTGRRTPQRFLLTLGPLTWLGRISYGVYLYHMPIFSQGVWGPAYHVPLVTRTVAVLGLSIFTAWLSFVVIEKPLLKIGRRFRGGHERPKEPLVRPTIPALAGRFAAGGAAAAVIGWLLVSGSREVVDRVARYDPFPPPHPAAAEERIALSPPEKATKDHFAQLDVMARDSLVELAPDRAQAIAANAWSPFVLGVTPEGGRPFTGIALRGEPERLYFDLTAAMSTIQRAEPARAFLAHFVLAQPYAAALAETYPLDGVDPAVAAERRSRFTDVVAGVLLRRMNVAVPEREVLDLALHTAMYVEMDLRLDRPKHWDRPNTFAAGDVPQRMERLLRGMQIERLEDAEAWLEADAPAMVPPDGE